MIQKMLGVASGRKVARIWGLGLVAMCLLAMGLLSCVPASAGTLILDPNGSEILYGSWAVQGAPTAHAAVDDAVRAPNLPSADKVLSVGSTSPNALRLDLQNKTFSGEVYQVNVWVYGSVGGGIVGTCHLYKGTTLIDSIDMSAGGLHWYNLQFDEGINLNQSDMDNLNLRFTREVIDTPSAVELRAVYVVASYL